MNIIILTKNLTYSFLNLHRVFLSLSGTSLKILTPTFSDGELRSLSVSCGIVGADNKGVNLASNDVSVSKSSCLISVIFSLSGDILCRRLDKTLRQTGRGGVFSDSLAVVSDLYISDYGNKIMFTVQNFVSEMSRIFLRSIGSRSQHQLNTIPF